MKSVLVQCDFLSMDRWANNQGGACYLKEISISSWGEGAALVFGNRRATLRLGDTLVTKYWGSTRHFLTNFLKF